MRRWWSALRGDARGSMLVEFAVVLPVLFVLYVGSFVLLDEFTAGRKVTITTRTITDLTTRYDIITTAQAKTVLAASAQVLVPYAGDSARARMSELLVTGPTTGRVMWSVVPSAQTSDALMPALASCATVILPNGLVPVNTHLVMGEVNITYHPVVGLGAPTDMVLRDRSFMSPRNVTSIALDGATMPTCP